MNILILSVCQCEIRKHLRYLHGIIRTEQFGTLPKTIQRCGYRTWHYVLENLFDKMLVETGDAGGLTEVFQTPCDIEHIDCDLGRFLY